MKNIQKRIVIFANHNKQQEFMSDAEYSNMTPKQMEFAVFCVMCVAEELQKPPTEVYDLMMHNRVMQDYIVEFYDVLHTQSREYIVEDIINLMKENQII